MKKIGILLCSILFCLTPLWTQEQETSPSFILLKNATIPQGIALTQLAYNKGVKIGVGTDMHVNDFPEIHPLFKEMETLVKEVGMTPMEVLKAATRINAEMIGMEQIIGSLVTGKRADIIVLDKNPLEDIQNVGSTKYIFKNGKRMQF